MQIVVGSAFRNVAGLAHLYMRQVANLRQWTGQDVRVIAVEGDSVDDTRRALQQAAAEFLLPLDLRTCNHGGPIFGSTEEEARMVALSKVGNAIFDGVTEDDDVLVYVECDLRWRPEVIATLVEHATYHEQFHIFAPLTFAGAAFYDTWGFRKDGQRFSPFDPFHPALNGGITEVDSAGSCLVMRGSIARAVRIKNNYCLVGWCEEARNQGFRIATNRQWRIEHL